MTITARALTNRCILSISGEDASVFLHSQLTVAVTDADRRPRLAAWCDARGRTLCLFRLFPAETGWLLSLPKELADSVVKRLRMFVLRSDVTITDSSSQYSHCAGSGNEQALTLGGGSWQEWLEPANPELPAIATGELIQAGIPEVLSQTSGLWVPQWLGLDRLNAIDFDKGCYPGQEVVAKLKYRAEVKRGLFRTAIKGDKPDPGAKIRDTQGKSQGEIVIAAEGAALAVLRLEPEMRGLVVENGADIAAAIAV